LKDLGVFNSKDLDKILRGLEEGIDHLNSLVKNMEDNGVDTEGKSEDDEMDLTGVDVGELRKLKAISEVI
jgi:hypothetical protein